VKSLGEMLRLWLRVLARQQADGDGAARDDLDFVVGEVADDLGGGVGLVEEGDTSGRRARRLVVGRHGWRGRRLEGEEERKKKRKQARATECSIEPGRRRKEDERSRERGVRPGGASARAEPTGAVG